MTSILNSFKLPLALGATMVLAGLPQIARAGVIPYAAIGTPNAVTYTFTAAATGDVIGYFAGSGASYDEQVGMLINGVLSSAGYGLDDHSSSVGLAFNFGHVTAGDTLVFVDHVISTGNYFYSDPSLNVPYDSSGVTNHNHVYSTDAAAGQISALIPAGTYVGFEDLVFPGSDYNYRDDTFVFTNVATVASRVPEMTSTLGLCVAGLGVIGALRRKFLRA